MSLVEEVSKLQHLTWPIFRKLPVVVEMQHFSRTYLVNGEDNPWHLPPKEIRHPKKKKKPMKPTLHTSDGVANAHKEACAINERTLSRFADARSKSAASHCNCEHKHPNILSADTQP